jgi:pimeloyl-ACP methyl ester carboxylesterase
LNTFSGTINFNYHQFGPLLQISEIANAEEAGEAAGTLLLIHGFGSTQYDWPLELLETLAYERKVIIFDNPRIGLSTDTSDEPLTIDYMANATLGLIKALELARPDILGYSMGGDVALSLAVQHGDQVGAIIAMAASFGGPDAPQPQDGLAAVLTALETVFLSKYAFISPGPASIAITSPMAALIGPAETNTTEDGAVIDPNKLFFPQGTLDLAYCNLYNDFFSLVYAVGLAVGIEGTGYAVPDIIPSYLALIPTPEALTQQKNALLQYHSSVSQVEALLPTISNQIMFISGVQDNIIPIMTQLKAVELSPGAWLMQVPDGGHGLPFLEPATVAETAVSFLDQAQALGPAPKSYYTSSPSSGAIAASVKVTAVAVAGMALLFSL